MPACRVDPMSLPGMTFDWGYITWFVAPDHEATREAGLSFGQVTLLPGKGHERHQHPESEEVLYVLSGRGEQMVDDGEPFPVAPGDTIYVPLAAWHSTLTTGREPLVLLATYNPAGAENALRSLPDFGEIAPGEVPRLTQA